MGGTVGMQSGQYMGGASPSMPGTAAPYIQSQPQGAHAPPPMPTSHGKGFIPAPGQRMDPRAFFFSQFLSPIFAHMQARQGRAEGGGVEEDGDEEDRRIARAVALARQVMEGK